MRKAMGVLALLLLGAAATSAASAEDLASYSGATLFGRFCASCHGPRGEGDGPVAPFFKVAPPDLTKIAARHGGTFPEDKIRAIVDGRANVAHDCVALRDLRRESDAPLRENARP